MNLTTRSDIEFGGHISRFTFFGEADDIQGISVTFNESNRFKRFSLSHSFGKREGKESRFTSAGASYRVLPGLDVGLKWSLSSFDGEDRLTVGTISYEFGPLDSLTGRFVNRNGDTNAYLAYRHGGGSGIEYYVIVGDPNADKWTSRVSFKVVFAF